MNNPLFKFTSHATGGDQFTVVSYTATEGLSSLYRYDITLKAPLSAAIDLDDMLDNPARFSIDTDEGEFPVHGVLSTFDEVRMSGEYVFYQATLVPRLWKLSTYKTNEIYTTELTVDNIIRTVLDNADLKETVDFDISGVKNTLLQRNYVCQFRESDFAFISRLMENEGIYFFFEQGADSEILIIADDGKYDPVDMPDATFDTAPQSHRVGETVQSWLCRKQRLPENVTVRDYNPEQPSLDVYDTHSVDTAGQGTEYLYGENFLTETEAEHLAQVRAEAFICRKTRYYGESGICGLTAGYTFSLGGHPNDKYNDIDYLVVEVTHEGQFLDQNASDNSETSPIYNNTFVAIEASIPWRPPVKTPKPRFFGTMTAFVYAEATSEMAEINPEGCYRVHMPFDRADGSKESTDPDRKASCWIRMAQPYVGEGEGMYFPLRGGTEVLLTFINGDPDRPVISGALPNASTPSLLTSEKPTESIIRTRGNNKIRMEDQPGSERIMLDSPSSNSWIRVGAENDPIVLNGESPTYIVEGENFTDPGAQAIRTVFDPAASPSFQAKQLDAIQYSKVVRPDGLHEHTSSFDFSTAPVGRYSLHYYDNPDHATRTVQVIAQGQPDVDLTGTDTDGIRIRSTGNLWFEAKSRYGEYHAGYAINGPTNGGTGSPQIGDLLSNFNDGYNPTGLKSRLDGSDQTFSEALVKGHVRVSSLDTFTTQEGNIYDFGGYWNYNLGNSYAEDHVNQKAELNTRLEKCWPDLNYGQVAGVGVGQAVTGGVVSAVVSASALSGTIAASGAGFSVTPEGAPFIGAAIGIAGSFIYQAGFSLIGGAFRFEDNVGDCTGGPSRSNDIDNDKIETWAKYVKSSFSDATDPESKQDFALDNEPMNKATAWVEKKVGDSYDYKRGNTIEITNGHTESHYQGNQVEYTYGGTREEFGYNGKGIQTHWEKKGGGVSQEASFDTQTGALLGYSFKNRNFINFDFDIELPSSPKFIVSASIAPMTFKVDVSIGMTMEIIAQAAINMKMDFSKTLSMELTPFKALHLKIEQGNIDTNIPFFQNKFKTTLAEQELTRLTSLLTDIDTAATKVSSAATDVENRSTKLANALVTLIN